MFLITTGAVTTAFFAAFQAEQYFLSIGAAIFGAAASYCFWRLDQRSGQLIKLGEAVLDQEQKRLKDIVKYNDMLIIKRAEKKESGRFRSYRQVLSLLFWTTSLMYTAGILLAVCYEFADPCAVHWIGTIRAPMSWHHC